MMTPTRTVTKTAVVAVCFFAISSLTAATATDTVAEESSVRQRRDNDDDDDAATTVVVVTPANDATTAVKFVGDYATRAICSYSPDFCAKHQLQSRGIQSYLATAGTLFAGVLGIILTKIKILIVLSLMSTVIGKMLLLYAFFKSYDPYHHHHIHKPHHHAPFVKYTRDKYYIKQTPSEHSHDVIVGSEHTPYHGHQPSGGMSYYKR